MTSPFEAFKNIFDSWQDGCLADHEAILQLIAISPGTNDAASVDAERLEAIAAIARSQEGIFKSRLRAQFETFLEESLCVESVGSSISVRIFTVLMAAWDRDEIFWQPGNLDFTFYPKGEK